MSPLFTPVASPFSLPVNLPVDSPWPLLLCRRKKSLLLSVTQSFRAFLRRTSSGFSHISSKREGREESQRCVVPCSWGSENLSASLSSGSGAAWSILAAVAYWFLHDSPAPPTAAGLGLPRLASSRPIYSSCTHCNQIAYEVRYLTLMLHCIFLIWDEFHQHSFERI